VAGKIQNRYSALVRELDISDYAPNYRITDDVVPVVVLHEHCEGECLASSSSGGSLSANDILATITPPHAGAYQITLYADWIIAIAQNEAMAWWIRQGTQNVTLLRYLVYGATGNQAGHMAMTIPKLHIPEGCIIVGQQMTATAAGDYTTMGLLVQPV